MNLKYSCLILSTLLINGVFAAQITPCEALMTKMRAAPDISDLSSYRKEYNALNAVDNDCLVLIFAMLEDRHINDGVSIDKVVSTIKGMPKLMKLAAQDENASIFVEFDDPNFVQFMQSVLKRLPTETLALFLRGDKCELVSEESLKFISTNKKLAKMVKADCAAQFQAHELPAKTGIKNFNDDFLSKREKRLHASWYTMSKEQLAKYQSDKDLISTRCEEKIMLERLQPSMIAAIPSDCLNNAFEKGDCAFDCEQLKKITIDQVKSLSIAASLMYEASLERSNPDIAEAWKHVKAEIVDELIAKSFATSMPIPAASIKSATKVTADAFMFMQPTTQLAIMEIVKDLPDDIFSKINSDIITEWKDYTPKKSKKTCSGLECFNLVSNRGNAAQLMSNVPTHVCMDFSLQNLNGANLFGEHMTKSCYKEMDVDEDDLIHYDGVHEHVLQYINWADAKKAFENQWEDLATDYIKSKGKKEGKHFSAFRGILRNGKICKYVITEKMYDSFKKDYPKAIDAFSSSCVRSFPFYKKFTADDFKLFNNDVYSVFTKDDKARIDFAKSSTDQIALISSRVSVPGDHYAAALEASEVSGYSVELFNKLHESWFRTMSPAAFAAISVEQIQVVQVDNLAGVDETRIAVFNKGAASALTAAQVEKIGTALVDPKDATRAKERAIVEALGKLSLSDGAKQAYKDRLEALKDGSVSFASASFLAAAAGLAFLIPSLL